jgi:hypothetical protein
MAIFARNKNTGWACQKLMAENLESLHVKHKESLWSWHLHVVTKGNLQEVRIEKLVDIEWLKIDTSMDVLEVLDVSKPFYG